MKAEFELTLDHSGRAVITFKHHDKDSGLEQTTLGHFLKEAATKGIVLEQTGQTADIGGLLSHDKYIIRIDQSGKQEACKGQSSDVLKLATAHREACMEWETKMNEVLHADSVSDVVFRIKQLQEHVLALLDMNKSIREYIGADDNESTFDEVQRLMQKKH